ncbi:MAG: hypothetical protein M3Z15_10670 [Pseudomonadota bacterium]|nr:hypothetical protein [Pseudomonadota bacterium]
MAMHRVMFASFGHRLVAVLRRDRVAIRRRLGSACGHRRRRDPLERDRQREDERDDDVYGARHFQSLVQSSGSSLCHDGMAFRVPAHASGGTSQRRPISPARCG